MRGAQGARDPSGMGADVLSISLQKELALLGNVWFERCFVSTTHLCGCVPFEVIEQAIVEVGVDTTVLSTDLGQPQTPPPAEGFRALCGASEEFRFFFRAYPADDVHQPGSSAVSGRGRRSLKTFKGALIGCGFFSQHHQEAWRRVPDAEIVAACDLSLERARSCGPAGLYLGRGDVEGRRAGLCRYCHTVHYASGAHLPGGGARAGDHLPKANGA